VNISEDAEPTYIIASVTEYVHECFDKDSHDGKWVFVSSPAELLAEIGKQTSIKYIFFPHWRWIVPSEIVNKYNCVCFHMTDLPYGRGGSPLQNLIIRGHKDTVLTVLKMDEGIDTGPIYIKEHLDLGGTAQEIYIRAAELTWSLIRRLVDLNPIPQPQVGKPVYFKRRLPAESKLPDLDSLEQLYDFIRMLDAPGYPHAFLETNKYRIKFTKVSLSNQELSAKVTIQLKEKNHG